MRVDRIVITGDVLRTTNGDPNQIFNVRWLYEELAEVLYALTGLRPEIRYRRNAADDGRALVTEWFGLLGRAPSVAGWAATYDTAAPPVLVAALAPDYANALVIGYELSPLLRSALDSLGAPWIDVELSPVRFLDDLALNLRPSWAAADRIDHAGLVAPGQVDAAVADLRARYTHDRAAAACSGACIFIAQTCNDRTLIRDGAFFPDSEAVERVAQMLGGRRLILKPHPLQPDNPIIELLREAIGADVTDANIYALLSAASDVRLATISSSAAIEARHFGHSPVVLHAAGRARPAPLRSLWAHRSAAFWYRVLAPVLPVRADVTFEAPMVPDRLRRKLSTWWGFARQTPTATVTCDLEHPPA